MQTTIRPPMEGEEEKGGEKEDDEEEEEGDWKLEEFGLKLSYVVEIFKFSST